MSALSTQTIMSYSPLPHLPFNFSFGTFYFSVCLCISMPRFIDLSLIAGTHRNPLNGKHTVAAADVHVPEATDFLFQTQALLGQFSMEES